PVVFSIVGLIPVKSDFFVENNYLKNHFNPAFRMPVCVALGISNTENSATVSSGNGRPLFHLVLNEKEFLEIPDYRFIFFSLAALLLFFISTHLFAVYLKHAINPI